MNYDKLKIPPKLYTTKNKNIQTINKDRCMQYFIFEGFNKYIFYRNLIFFTIIKYFTKIFIPTVYVLKIIKNG